LTREEQAALLSDAVNLPDGAQWCSHRGRFRGDRRGKKRAAPDALVVVNDHEFVAPATPPACQGGRRNACASSSGGVRGSVFTVWRCLRAGGGKRSQGARGGARTGTTRCAEETSPKGKATSRGRLGCVSPSQTRVVNELAHGVLSRCANEAYAIVITKRVVNRMGQTFIGVESAWRRRCHVPGEAPCYCRGHTWINGCSLGCRWRFHFGFGIMAGLAISSDERKVTSFADAAIGLANPRTHRGQRRLWHWAATTKSLAHMMRREGHWLLVRRTVVLSSLRSSNTLNVSKRNSEGSASGRRRSSARSRRDAS
jgi:hypothetical protein